MDKCVLRQYESKTWEQRSSPAPDDVITNNNHSEDLNHVNIAVESSIHNPIKIYQSHNKNISPSNPFIDTVEEHQRIMQEYLRIQDENQLLKQQLALLKERELHLRIENQCLKNELTGTATSSAATRRFTNRTRTKRRR